MKALLDTHVLAWWLIDDARLSGRARLILRQPDNSIWVSPVSGWELATKARIGKLQGFAHLVPKLPELVAEASFSVLPVTLEHAIRAGAIRHAHKDPFDRMLVAQANLESMVLVTSDPICASLGARTTW